MGGFVKNMLKKSKMQKLISQHLLGYYETLPKNDLLLVLLHLK
jgi:hypothetical protein